MHKKRKIKQEVKLVGKWLFEVRDAKTGKLNKRIERFNIVPTVGLAAIAAQFGKSTITKDVGDNQYIAVGSDNTPVAAGDTTLGTETTRKLQGSKSAASVVASIVTFFAAGEATGNHEEFGLFGDGDTTTASAVADSGILYSHVLASVGVLISETLTVTFELSLST